MPTYTYKCEKCEHKFKEFQKMTDEPIKKCPECGGKVKKLISPGAGVIFKGKGFYQTDYKTPGTGSKKKDSGPAPCGKEDGCSGCGA